MAANESTAEGMWAMYAGPFRSQAEAFEAKGQADTRTADTAHWVAPITGRTRVVYLPERDAYHVQVEYVC